MVGLDFWSHLHLCFLCLALHFPAHQLEKWLSVDSLSEESSFLAVAFLFLQAREELQELALEHHIELHEDDVAEVPQEEYQGLPPSDGVIKEEEDKDNECDGVEGGVTDKGPGGELKSFSTGKGTSSDDKENVEDGAADDGSDANVGDGDEDANDGGEEFGSRSSGCHESCSCHIVTDPPPGKSESESC